MSRHLIFSTSTEMVRIPSDAVVFIAADGNYSAITTADGKNFVLTMGLGHIERRISQLLDPSDTRFIRIGKSLIVNRDFIAFVHPTRQKMILSDCRTFRHEVAASKEALKVLKDLMDKE